MTDCEQLGRIVQDLIEVMQLQVKELEKLVAQADQMGGRQALEQQFSVVGSELSELHRRIKHLNGL